MARICLINPRFPTSFWGLNHGLPLLGKKANMPVLALPVLAGLTPPEHEVVLIDENIQELDFDALEAFDIVGLTGMTVQRDRMREILRELRPRGVFAVLGGPWITVAEDWYDGLVDVIFVGEAEETWPQFLDDWERGEWKARYEQAEKTDLTKVPPPRFDLVPFRDYAMGCVQTSRGCPFQCEFCDIIVIFGRRPRIKTPAQVVAEVEAQRRLGARVIFLVDDNFIGNKKAAKGILRALIAWQHKHGYPLAFFTEASLDLAEDDELIRLMTEAGMAAVFIGI
ncbi:MAG TPA: radical SAM protein, partial [Isosphaeraceae bacterium]|nr:radical SAM protein [Isosphaeraceae bacterium]